MPTKTITLEQDARDKMRLAKRGGESFPELVRRSVLVDPPLTGASLKEFFRNGRSGVSAMWIAATGLAHGMSVVTNNVEEFERVTGLSVITY